MGICTSTRDLRHTRIWTPWRRVAMRGLAWYSLAATTWAQSDGLPRGCQDMPYVRYEAEQGTQGGGAVSRTAPDFNPALTAAEASDQHYIGLPTTGSFVEWTVTQAAQGLTLRFTLPDNATGDGVAGSLSVLVNGTNAATLNLSSYWAWTYFVSSNPQNTPGVRPRMRFDEVHLGLPFQLQPGDVLTIRKDITDGLEYGIDFVELEEVPEARPRPPGFVSVADHGANGLDALADSLAFSNAWQAAKAAGTGLYIPPGRYLLTGKWNLGNSTHLAIQGAGIWHTELFFTTRAVGAGGIATGENTEQLEISHFFMSSVLNARHLVPGQLANYKAFDGCFGSQSSIHDVWLTHFETGAWCADYNAPVQVTALFTFASNRVRNTYADGVNFAQGTRSSTIRHCSFRDNGDDAMAIWPSNSGGAPEGYGNVFHNNTVEFTYRAAGAGIFGGYGHAVHHCIFKDGIDSSGLRFTEDFGGYHFQNNTQIRIYENTFIARGTSLDVWNWPRAAIEISGAGVQHLYFENNNILDSPRHAIQLQGGHDLYFTNTTVQLTGLDTFTNPGGAAVRQYDRLGSAYFRHLIMSGIENNPSVIKELPAYVLVIENQFPLTDRSSLSIPEGETAPLSVSLSFQPAGVVTVTVARITGDTDILVQSGASLLFDGSNWSNAQIVTFLAAEDTDDLEGSAQIRCRAEGFGDTVVTIQEIENDFNHPPNASTDFIETDEDEPVSFQPCLNDTDPDDDPLQLVSTAGTQHGTVVIVDQTATYTPAAGYFGPDEFTYVATDGRGGSATGRVYATVHEVVTPNPHSMEIRFSGYTGNEPLTNFPALIRFHPALTNFSYSQFASTAGHDLRFSNELGMTLNYEVENWDTAGTSHVWVQLPVLTNQSRIWATWGSPDNHQPDYATNGAVWSAGYAGVYHNRESSGPRMDSTPNGRHGIPFGHVTGITGRIASGNLFDGSGDYIELPSTFVLFNGRVETTVEFWFLARSLPADSNWLLSPVLFQGNGESAWMVTLGDSIPGDAIGSRVDQDGWTTTVWQAGIQASRWYHCAVTYSPTGAGNWKLHLDGHRVAEGTRSGSVGHLTEKNAYGGNTVGTDRWFDGIIDEVRVSAVARSSNWVWASWLNVASNETFAAYGSVAAPPPPAPPAETVLVDFGSDESFRGTSVSGSDANGNFWNSVWSGTVYPNLINTRNQGTGVILAFDAATGTDSYNGPSNAVDAVLLGPLGGAPAAVNDYYVSSRFRLGGLDTNRTYTLRFFGSHKYSDNDSTVYSVFTDAAYTGLVASAYLHVQSPGSPAQHNSNTLAVIAGLSPQSGNALYIQFQGTSSLGYLNALQVDSYLAGLSFEQWAQGFPGLGGPAEDDDGDGLSNLGEFALGGNPTNIQDSGHAPRIIARDGSQGPAYVYTRRSGSVGLYYQLEGSTNLLSAPWTSLSTSEAPGNAAGFESVTNPVPPDLPGLFLRTRLIHY